MNIVTKSLTFAVVTVAALATASVLALQPTAPKQEVVHLARVVVTGKRVHVEQLPRVIVAGHAVRDTQVAQATEVNCATPSC